MNRLVVALGANGRRCGALGATGRGRDPQGRHAGLGFELDEGTGVVDRDGVVEGVAAIVLEDGDADDFATLIDDRTSAVAAGHRRIQLEVLVSVAIAQPADASGRCRVLEKAEGISNHHDAVPRSNGVGVSEGGCGQPKGIRLQDGDVPRAIY